MTGRGIGADRRRIVPGRDDALIQVPISLSTSPAELDPASDEPFHVVVTAHNPADRAITFLPQVTPFMSIRWGAFEKFTCTTSPAKVIDIWPTAWPNWVLESEDLERDELYTIPASGSLSVELEVPREAIEKAHVASGEHYRTSLVLKYNGCKWWSYGTSQDLEGIRLRMWRPEPEVPDLEEGEEDLMQKEWRETYGDGPWTFGEKPWELCFVGDGPVEFSVK